MITLYRFFMSLLLLMWLLLLACSQQQTIPAKIINHQLVVELDPVESKIFAIDTVHLDCSRCESFSFFLNKNLNIDRIRAGKQSFDYTAEQSFDLAPFVEEKEASLYDHFYDNGVRYSVDLPPQLNPDYIEIRYSGVVHDSLKQSAFSRMMIANQTSGLISEEGVFLGGETLWYPTVPNSLASFELITRSPAGFRTVTSGQLLSHKETADSSFSHWQETNPVDHIYLCAGDYEVKRSSSGDIEVATYFFKDSQHLADKYLQACNYYLNLYTDLIGPYPFAKFAVVENFFPTGYGMPSFTLLGSRVIRLPFMTRISLGHEICHNWWGNSVFVDMEQGNWCEGLTTFCADYYYKERESRKAAKQYRYDLLKDYASYVTHDSLDFSLNRFQERSTPGSRTIGYGKSMMIFHMLRNRVGDERFFNALQAFYQEKRFQYASWSDIESVFNRVCKTDLGLFFEQWTTKPGAIQLALQAVSVEKTDTTHVLSAQLVQKEPFYQTVIPVTINHGKTVTDTLLQLKDKRTALRYTSKQPFTGLAVDPDYAVFRRLHWQEITPSLSQFFGDRRQIIVLPSKAAEKRLTAYKSLASRLNRTDEADVLPDTKVDSAQLATHSLMLLGSAEENRLVAKVRTDLPVTWRQTLPSLMGTAVDKPEQCLVIAARNPFQKRKTMIWVMGHGPEGIEAVAAKLPHYGKYGFLLFNNGRNILKGNWQVESPLTVSFNQN